MSVSPALALYLGISRIAGPGARLWLAWRVARGREERARLGERLGWASLPRAAGRLVWLHAASLGEALSLLPLVAEIRRQEPEARCLVTTGTVDSARRMAEHLPEGCIHQYFPVDTAAAVRRFLGHWRPDLAIWVESELWPRLMVETGCRGVPMILVNARISARSARRWAWAPGMAAALVRRFARIVTQDAETAARLIAMGAEPRLVSEGGNLKALVAPPGCDGGELRALQALLGGRPVWLAASTHPPEEALAAAAHRAARRALPRLLAIVAPRHPERGEAIADLLGQQGLIVARRSRGEVPGAATDVWLADTLGELGLWYRLAPVAFLGGSLAPRGGHNPFEPAALGVAILHGPDTRNFAPAYAALAAAGGARVVADGAGLGAAVADLLGSEDARLTMAGAAARVRRELAPDVAALARDALALVGTGA